MKAVAYLAERPGEALEALIGALEPLGVHVQPARPEKALRAALLGLVPLGFSGAWVEEELGEAVFAELERAEVEARTAGRVDAVIPAVGGLTGHWLLPRALARLMQREAPLGVRVLWVGDDVSAASGLRGVARVDLLASSQPAAEQALAALPAGVRGEAASSPHAARRLATGADWVIHAGGPLPLDLLLPFQTLVSFRYTEAGAARLVERVFDRRALLAERLALFAQEALGVDLPADAFRGG